MSVRVVFLWIYVLFFSVHAWRKSWFQAVCASVLLMAFAFHPDVPESLGGIRGLNPMNLMLLSTTLAWLMKRRSEGVVRGSPSNLRILLFLYFAVVSVSTARLLLDLESYYSGLWDTSGQMERMHFFTEYVFDMFRYLIPALLVYEGCRTRGDVQLALGCVLGMYFLIAVQVVNYMPISALTMSGEELSGVAYKLLRSTLGYSRVTISMLLSGASWGILCSLCLVNSRLWRDILLLCAGLVGFGQALTGGRMGYVTFGFIGLVLGVVRWRRMLLVVPLVVMLAIALIPAARERMLMGMGTQGVLGTGADLKAMTSGRLEVWPYVGREIRKSVLIGYGREGMIRSGLHLWISTEVYGYPDFAHPHNAYLQFLLDNGVIGFALAMPFFVAMLRRSFSLLFDRRDPLFAAVGGAAVSLEIALVVAALGGQTFYPTHQSLGLWTMFALVLRVSGERERHVSN